jgi:hypothetical protein
MADNLQIQEGASGKYSRTIEKTASIHSSITAVDIGAGTTETRLVAGQAAMAASIPVVVASDQSALPVGGAAATGAALSGNPVPAGIEVRTSRRSGESNGDVLPFQGNAIGVLIAELHSLSADRWCSTGVVTTTGDFTVKAATASLRHFLTHLSITNDSNVYLRAALYDGTSAGTKIGEWLLPPGGGISMQSTSGWLNSAVNTALTLKLSAAPSGTVPSGGTAAVLVSATGYTGV